MYPELSHTQTCCTPREPERLSSPSVLTVTNPSEHLFDVCNIPGGTALVGTDHPLIPIDEEAPCRRQEIQPFRMMKTTVTNRMFNDFINETAYVTEAQRFGWSFVFHDQLKQNRDGVRRAAGNEWWLKVDGACWHSVGGPQATVQLEDDHPVVHVSWNDAKAFADWAGGRLPTEAEWEHAARGGLGDVPFPWGHQAPDENHFHPCNIWQGHFPDRNTCADGYAATAPATSFEPNGYGLYQMCGNVWEWTSGRFKLNGRSAESKQHARHFKRTKILKGGSYLCHKSYCFRYRIAARTGSTPDSTTTHQGFRLVFSSD